jgi:uncharacterized protein HemX
MGELAHVGGRGQHTGRTQPASSNYRRSKAANETQANWLLAVALCLGFAAISGRNG